MKSRGAARVCQMRSLWGLVKLPLADEEEIPVDGVLNPVVRVVCAREVSFLKTDWWIVLNPECMVRRRFASEK